MKPLTLAALVALGGSSLSASNPLFAFDTPQSAWTVVNDDVMGGVSSSRAWIEDGLLVFAGQVRLENNGGFASVRSGQARLDLQGATGLRVRLRGDGKRYGFQLSSSSARGVLYRSDFVTPAGQWLELNFPLLGFQPTRFGRVLSGPALNPQALEGVGFIVGNGRAERFRLEVDWIRAY